MSQEQDSNNNELLPPDAGPTSFVRANETTETRPSLDHIALPNTSNDTQATSQVGNSGRRPDRDKRYRRKQKRNGRNSTKFSPAPKSQYSGGITRPGAVAVGTHHHGDEEDGTVVYDEDHATVRVPECEVVVAELAQQPYFNEEELRNRIIEDITGNLAVAATVDDGARPFFMIALSKRTMLLATAAILAIVAIVVGVVVGTTATSSSAGLGDPSQNPITINSSPPSTTNPGQGSQSPTPRPTPPPPTPPPPTPPPQTPPPPTPPPPTPSPTTECSDGPAIQLATPFSSNGSWFGVFFDMVVNNEIEVTEIVLHVASTESVDVRIYSKAGTHVGFERQSNQWQLVADTTVVGQGRSSGTPVRLAIPVPANAGDTRAFFTSTNIPTLFLIGTQRGDVIVSNGDLQILEGTVHGCGPTNSFTCGADIHHPRVFNGIVKYCLL
jgi:hypothetical protein